MLFPSGDHVGNPLFVFSTPLYWTFDPSAFMIPICPAGCPAGRKYMPLEKAIFFPSGDHTGERTKSSGRAKSSFRSLPSGCIETKLCMLQEITICQVVGDADGKNPPLASLVIRKSGCAENPGSTSN